MSQMIFKDLPDIINTLSGVAQAHSEERTLIEDLLGGTRAMRGKRTLYLPQEDGESVISYNNRIARTFLNNYFKHTVGKLSSEVFSKEIFFEEPKNEVEERAIKNVKRFSYDIDFEGNDITTFAKENFESGISYGSSIIHVNFPEIPGLEFSGNSAYYKDSKGRVKPINLEEQKKNGWRPFFVHYPITSVMRNSESRVNGVTMVDGLVFKDKVFIESPIYDRMAERLQYFYMENGMCKFVIWENTPDDSSWVLKSEGKTGLNFMPFVIFSPGEKINLVFAKPPLQTLAELNLVHYQSESDQRNILHYSRLITFFGKGLSQVYDEEKRVRVGANQVIIGDTEWADFKVIESTGSGIDQGERDLKSLEERMGMFGLSLLLPKSDRATATEKLIDTSESDSMLKSWAVMYQSVLRRAYHMLSLYYPELIRDEFRATPIVNTDLKTIFSTEALNYIVRGVEQNFISPTAAAKEYKRRSILAKDTDIENMINEIQANKEKDFELKNASQMQSVQEDDKKVFDGGTN